MQHLKSSEWSSDGNATGGHRIGVNSGSKIHTYVKHASYFCKKDCRTAKFNQRLTMLAGANHAHLALHVRLKLYFLPAVIAEILLGFSCIKLIDFQI